MKRLMVMVVSLLLVAGFVYAGCNVNARSGYALASRHHNWDGDDPSNNYHVTWEMKAHTYARSDEPTHSFNHSMTIALNGDILVNEYSGYYWSKSYYTPQSGTFTNTATGKCKTCSTILNTVIYKDNVWEFDNIIPYSHEHTF